MLSTLHSTTTAQVRKALIERSEIALLDVREEGPFAEAHPLFAASLPLGRLELEIGDRVPRRSTRIVVYDHGEGLNTVAVERLRALGYTDVSVLEGGLDGWRRAGGEIFPRREHAEQGVRGARGGSAAHAVTRRSRSQSAARCPRGRGRSRRPPVRGIPDDEHSDRTERTWSRAGVSGSGSGAVTLVARRGELCGTNEEHHRGAVTRERGYSEPGRCAQKRHHRLDPGRVRAGPRPNALRSVCAASTSPTAHASLRVRWRSERA